ncbi:MAG: rod shape-determining protein MreC [Acidobacteria bacterium]|nr:rod shape-determining protein MreC [Acidobacteriota bacterium]
MEGFFHRYRNALVLIAVVLVQTIVLATQVKRPEYGAHHDGHHVRMVRLWMNAVVSPFEKAFTYTGHGLRNLWHGYIDLRHTREMNRNLQQEIAQLRLREAALAEDARQGMRLRGLLEFRQQYVAKTVAAQVIGTSSTDSSHVLTLDKGSNAGLKPDMAVITPDGIVGKLRNVFPRSSELLLINDASSGAGVILENTRIRAVLHGSPNGITEITNLLPDSRIQPGDRVVTSGGDMIYPRGLSVGVVESIAPDRDHQPYARIVVHPAARLDKLEEVLIITQTADSIPGGPPQENAEAEPKSTSQIVSERLPGLHDPNEKKTEDADGKPVINEVPNAKPTPPVHPDRYSPGSTPAAADLQPGAPHTNGGER